MAVKQGKGAEVSRVKDSKRKPGWKTCSHVVGHSYVNNNVVPRTCDCKAMRNGKCPTHGGSNAQ